MIKIIGIYDQEIKISEAYIVEDKSAVAISNIFSDEEADEQYHCFEFSKYGVVMINDDGVWTDLELMTPSLQSESPCGLSDTICQKKGFPLLCVVGTLCDAKVEIKQDKFIVWLESDQVIDTMINNDNVEFLCSKEILVGIAVTKKMV